MGKGVVSGNSCKHSLDRRLKTLGGLTPYGYICKVWTREPDRFILDPIHQMPGLNTQVSCRSPSVIELPLT